MKQKVELVDGKHLRLNYMFAGTEHYATAKTWAVYFCGLAELTLKCVAYAKMAVKPHRLLYGISLVSQLFSSSIL